MEEITRADEEQEEEEKNARGNKVLFHRGKRKSNISVKIHSEAVNTVTCEATRRLLKQ